MRLNYFKQVTPLSKESLMTRNCLARAVALLLTIISVGFTENLIILKMGPSLIIDSKSEDDNEPLDGWHGHAELGYGVLFDRIIGIGAEADFAWRSETQDTTRLINDPVSGQERVTVKNSDDKRFMFPLSLFLLIDPISQFRVHQVLKGTFGFNMMVISSSLYRLDTSTSDPADVVKDRSDKSGFYYGLTASAAADAVFDLGEQASIFAGMEYRWANGRKRLEDTHNQYFEQNLNGLVFRAGLRFML